MRYTNLFGFFKDDRISQKKFALFFLIKLIAIPVMYLLYQQFYGGIENFDSGVFYRDSKLLNGLAWKSPLEFAKAILGLQDDHPGSPFFNEYIRSSSNWDNGRLRILFYNDNRVLIRLHSIIHFVAFNSYFVHAFFSCLFSYVGLVNIYKSLKTLFVGRETVLLAVLCFFPSLWLHTGALLKEGPAIFVLGGLLYELHFLHKQTLRRLPLLLVYLFFALLLKPYLLLFAALCFALFFYFQNRPYRFKSLWFLGLMICGLFIFDLTCRLRTQKSLYQIAAARQQVFSDAAKGGIFLLDSVRFIRLNYDSTLVCAVPEKPGYYRIRKGAAFMYWEHSHQQDTLFCQSNTDSVSIFQEAYRMPESRSNLSGSIKNTHAPGTILRSLYNALFYPFFFNARSVLHLLASFENLLILFALLVSVYGLIFGTGNKFPAQVFLIFAMSECLLVAFTSPNAGAIFRYRAPAILFILLSALYSYGNLLRHADPKRK